MKSLILYRKLNNSSSLLSNTWKYVGSKSSNNWRSVFFFPLTSTSFTFSSLKLSMCFMLLDMWRLGFTGWTASKWAAFLSISFPEWPHWDNDRGWSAVAELLFHSISHCEAPDDGVTGSGGGGVTGMRVFKGLALLLTLNCMAARGKRHQLEGGAEWSPARWAQPVAPVWHKHSAALETLPPPSDRAFCACPYCTRISMTIAKRGKSVCVYSSC